MRRFTPLFTVFAALLLMFTTGCGSKSNSPVSNFDVHEVIKSADRSYKVVIDSSSFYLKVSTSIQWPMQFGDADIEPLRRELLMRMYRDSTNSDVDAAIMSFINDVNIFTDSASFTEVATIPADDDNLYEIDYTGKLIELTERTVSYQIDTYSYLGGAHPNTASYPFTYDLLNACVLTLENMFKPGCEQALLSLIKLTLAMQEGVNENELDAAGFFTSDIFVSPMIYLANGGVVFHYNRYQIAPYAKGAIDVEVPSYELTPYLTQRADSLINQ